MQNSSLPAAQYDTSKEKPNHKCLSSDAYYNFVVNVTFSGSPDQEITE